MNDKYAGEDRRRFKRIKESFIVMYKVNFPLSVRMMLKNKEINAIALDLSERGMAVLTNYDIPQSTSVTERFIVFNESAISDDKRIRSVEVKGEVCYSFLTKERVHRIGIYFTDISVEDRNFIANLVKTALSRSPL